MGQEFWEPEHVVIACEEFKGPEGTEFCNLPASGSSESPSEIADHFSERKGPPFSWPQVERELLSCKFF